MNAIKDRAVARRSSSLIDCPFAEAVFFTPQLHKSSDARCRIGSELVALHAAVQRWTGRGAGLSQGVNISAGFMAKLNTH